MSESSLPGVAEMGRVTTPVLVENLADLALAACGAISHAEVRSVALDDALVDTGATRLAMPTAIIERLGLTQERSAVTMTAGGPRTVRLFSAVRLTIGDRTCPVDVTELPDGCPVLIGQVPLELMDWVVDPRNQRLMPNPAHGGQWVQELY